MYEIYLYNITTESVSQQNLCCLMVNQIKAVSGEMEVRGMPDSFPAKGFKGKSRACFYVGVLPQSNHGCTTSS